MAHLAFIFCCLVWGSSFILVERVTHVFSPVEIALWRFAGGVAVLGFIWWFKQRNYRLSLRQLGTIFLVALLFNAPPQIILPYLIHQGYGHSFFGPMVAPVPLITILVSIPMLGVFPTSRQLIGVLGGLACVWLIVDDGFDRGMSFVFVGLALWIPLSSALSNTVIKWKLGNVPAVPLTTAILLIAGLSLVPLEFSQPAMDAMHLDNPAVSPTAMTWVYLLVLGIVATGLSTAVFVWLILERGPLFAGMTTYVVPVLSLLWGTLDHERITSQQMVAIAGVLSMVALVQSGSCRQDVIVEPSAPPLPVTVPEEAVWETVTALPIAAEPLITQPESQVA